jgi:hypothetical protein
MCPGAWAWHHNTVMQHEAMHALGFDHEQNRPDRDEFVEIHPSVATDSNYAKLTPENWVNTSSPYDFCSVMHYPSELVNGYELGYDQGGPFGLASNWKPILIGLDWQLVGQKP